MKNILSYNLKKSFSGQEILNWSKHQVANKTSHYKQAIRILRLYGKTINPIRNYVVYSSYESWNCGNIVHKPLVVREGKLIPTYWN